MTAQDLEQFLSQLETMGGSFGPLPVGGFTTIRISPIDNASFPLSPPLLSVAQIKTWVDYMWKLRGKGSWAGVPLTP